MSAESGSADGPDWTPQQPTTWKLSLPCTKAEADCVSFGLPELDTLDPQPVVMASEPDPARPDDWRLDIYFEGEPGEADLAAIRTLAAGADRTLRPEPIEDEDWVTKSQAWLTPIRAGRFHVHTAAYADTVPEDAVSFRIEAGRAFGTGHHETTSGCLEMLDRLASDGAVFARVADIGTGTGLLAFAARALWPAARIVASDIDPIAIEVTAANMAANAIGDGAILLVAAEGLDDPRLAAAAPFDLLIANILAGPLIALAPSFAGAMRSGGTIILAGLLATQEADLLEAYAAHGCTLASRIGRGDWTVLMLHCTQKRA